MAWGVFLYMTGVNRMSKHRFIRTKMSESAESLLFADSPPPVEWSTFVEELLAEDCKVSIRYGSKFGGYSFSVTGSPDTANENCTISMFGDSIEKACTKVQLVLGLLPSPHSKWDNIERIIKELESEVARIVRENMDKIRTNLS